MMIHGTSLAARLPGEAEPRFWYWHGASGRRYIHSIYKPDVLPPLPGATYVAVRRIGAMRTAIAVGRFSVFWDQGMSGESRTYWRQIGADEVHVHLLGRDETATRNIAADLERAFSDQMAVSIAA
jgi:hypothetical protein